MADKVHHGTTIIDDTSIGQPPPPPYAGPPPPGAPYSGYPPLGPPPVVHEHVYTAAVVRVPTVVVNVPVGSSPSTIVCRSCNQQIVTRVENRATTRTHLFAALLCLLGCWPCVCVPYCMDSCQSADHYCTNCGAYIGSYQS